MKNKGVLLRKKEVTVVMRAPATNAGNAGVVRRWVPLQGQAVPAPRVEALPPGQVLDETTTVPVARKLVLEYQLGAGDTLDIMVKQGEGATEAGESGSDEWSFVLT